MSDENPKLKWGSEEVAEQWTEVQHIEFASTGDAQKARELFNKMQAEIERLRDPLELVLETTEGKIYSFKGTAGEQGYEPITEDWLKKVGFKWHQLDRQNEKQWLLWLGGAFIEFMGSPDDLGIEIASGFTDGDGKPKFWFCWLRADYSGRYSRFIHVRHIYNRSEVIQLVVALTGVPWNPENHLYGVVRNQRDAAYLKREMERLDQKWLREGPTWRSIEKDDSRGGALPEHMQDSIDKGTSK